MVLIAHTAVDTDGSDKEDDDLDVSVTEKEAKEGGNADGERGSIQGKSILAETHCMKTRPICEGYRFFALTSTNWFVANFTLDGRTAAKIGCQRCVGSGRDRKRDLANLQQGHQMQKEMLMLQWTNS
eukprot:8647130-Ditylum_brightwellii.AAC.1